jgi:hypothetical protein
MRRSIAILAALSLLTPVADALAHEFKEGQVELA